MLSDGKRADRFLALTGLDPDSLRAALGDPATLAGVIDFLGSYEPDLVAAAEALGTTPAALIRAREEISG